MAKGLRDTPIVPNDGRLCTFSDSVCANCAAHQHKLEIEQISGRAREPFSGLTIGGGCAILAAIRSVSDIPASELSMILRSPTERAIEINHTLRISEEMKLLPIALLDGPTADEMLYSMDPRQNWRGFSFGNFWFGYYFGINRSSPQAKGRWAVQ